MRYLFFALMLLLSQQGVAQLSVALAASDAYCNKIASLETFHLYPNPSQGAFQFELAFKENVVGLLEIKDVLGKTVLQQRIEGQEMQEWIQLENKVAGIYFLSLNIDGQILTKKIKILK